MTTTASNGPITEELYLSSQFKTREELDQAIRSCVMPDATTTQWLANCPRRAQHALLDGLMVKDEAPFLRAGRALHAGMDTYYVTGDADLGLEEVRKIWGHGADWRLPPNHRYGHLHLGHLEVIFKNYIDFAKYRDTFRPVLVERSDLDLTDVLGAIWRVAPDGRVILGESKIVMEFTVEGQPFLYAGKPDLPIEMGGAVYLYDHKGTNSYLSKWYFDQFRFSNQFRGYCAMIIRITGMPVAGVLINGIYMGERASLSEFKGDKFARYGPMMYNPGQIAEGIRNQYHWRKTLDYHKSQGYFPQHTSRLCGGCPFDKLCASSPVIRDYVMQTEYVKAGIEFLDL